MYTHTILAHSHKRPANLLPFGLVLFLSLITSFRGYAQERPAEVPYFPRHILDQDSLQYLGDAWLMYAMENPTEEEAWLNYLRAVPNWKPQLDVDGVRWHVADTLTAYQSGTMAKALMEYHRIGEAKPWQADFLLEAYSLDPQHPMVLLEMLNYYAYQEEWALHSSVLARLSEFSLIPDRLRWYFANVLQSVDALGVLVAASREDARGLWFMQSEWGLRPDVLVVDPFQFHSLDFLQRICSKRGWTAPAVVEDRLMPESVRGLYWIKALRAVNPSVPLFWAGLSLSPYERTQRDGYIVGLARVFTDEVDNISKIEQNFEEAYFLDYLHLPQHQLSYIAVDRQYLSAAYLLYDTYLVENNALAAQKLLVLMERIALGAPSTVDVSSQVAVRTAYGALGRKGVLPMIRTHDTISTQYLALLEDMVAINDHTYMNRHETTNQEYAYFLQYIKQTGDLERLQAWLPAYTPSYLNQFGIASVEVLSDETYLLPQSFAQRPVVGIPWEAAMAYCLWLRYTYRGLDGFEKFREGMFRLPTPKEWEMAALGMGINNTTADQATIQTGENLLHQQGVFQFRYPWWYETFPSPPSILDSSACYRANVKVEEDLGCGEYGDGYPVLAPAMDGKPYHGLYDVIGNAAEMVVIPGISKGGSWGHTAAESEVQNFQLYQGKDMRVGFRVFWSNLRYHSLRAF